MNKEENAPKDGLVKMVATHSNNSSDESCNCGGPVFTDALGRRRRIHSPTCPKFKPLQ